MSKDVVIVGGARTPMCEYSGTPGFGKLKDVSAIDLAAQSTKAAVGRANVDPESIDHVVMGNALQTSMDAIYGAGATWRSRPVSRSRSRPSRSTACAAPGSSRS
ncbi:MAG: hypothetical protein QF410_03630 [Planctomycetota bacterium]|nr:hypothetical protein [Planctomycetota bacterium]